MLRWVLLALLSECSLVVSERTLRRVYVSLSPVGVWRIGCAGNSVRNLHRTVSPRASVPELVYP